MTYQDELTNSLLGGKFKPPNGNTGVTGGMLATPGLQAPVEAAPAPMPKVNRSFDDVYGSLSKRGVRTQQDMGRAFQESPDDFTGWSIYGSKGDKLKGEDGSVYDMIRNAGLGGQGLQRLRDAGPGGVPINRPQSSQSGGMGPLSMQGGLASLLTGDPTQAIQAALGEQTQGGDFLQQLLRQLGQ